MTPASLSNSELDKAREAKLNELYGNANDSKENAMEATNLDNTSVPQENAVESNDSKLLNLRELTSEIELTDTFAFAAKTPEGIKTFRVSFQRWDDGEIGSLVVGEPHEWAQPIRDYYIAQSAFGAVADLETSHLIDPDGLVMKAPYDVYDNVYGGTGYGYVSMGYVGEIDVPTPAPRSNGKSPDTFVAAWGELVKNSGAKDIGFVAARSGRYYSDIEDWKKAQKVFNQCETLMRIFHEGGITVWVGPALRRYAEYWHLLWNLAAHDPALAKEVSSQHYKARIQKNSFRKDERKGWGKAETAKKNGDEVATITKINGETLMEGVYYTIKTPAGLPVAGFRHSLTNRKEQETARAAKPRVEKGAWTLVASDF